MIFALLLLGNGTDALCRYRVIVILIVSCFFFLSILFRTWLWPKSICAHHLCGYFVPFFASRNRSRSLFYLFIIIYFILFIHLFILGLLLLLTILLMYSFGFIFGLAIRNWKFKSTFFPSHLTRLLVMLLLLYHAYLYAFFYCRPLTFAQYHDDLLFIYFNHFCRAFSFLLFSHFIYFFFYFFIYYFFTSF